MLTQRQLAVGHAHPPFLMSTWACIMCPDNRHNGAFNIHMQERQHGSHAAGVEVTCMIDLQTDLAWPSGYRRCVFDDVRQYMTLLCQHAAVTS